MFEPFIIYQSMVFLWVNAWSQQFQADSVKRQSELAIGMVVGKGTH
jgi:hypothetical protein